MSEIGEFVLDSGRYLGIHGAGEQAVIFEALERLRQHLRADALKATLELSVALRPVFESADHQCAPLIRQEIEHLPARAHRSIDIVAFALIDKQAHTHEGTR